MSCKIEAILDEERLVFVYKDTALVELMDAIDTYNMLNTQLRMEFAEKPFFHFTIKNHALAHVALQAAVLSPRFCLWGPYLLPDQNKKHIPTTMPEFGTSQPPTEENGDTTYTNY
eukprot:3575012-Amphidinium_carterae.3